MPSIFGFTLGNIKKTNAKDDLKSMQRLMNHLPHIYQEEPVYLDDFIGVSAIYKDKFYDQSKSFSDDFLHVWLDGEIYDKSHYGDKFDHSTLDSEIVSYLYKKNDDWNFLKKMDGVFTAVIYDKNVRKLFFITDRYGLGYLYLYENNNRIAWSSESKAFLKLGWFPPKIREEGMGEFIKYGYHIGDKTWLKNVELLSPGTVLSFDLRTKQKKVTKYWSWGDIDKMSMDDCKDIKEIAMELGRLFIKGVEERSKVTGGVNLGLNLSGGLDSRAILAAIPEQKSPLYALTFGKKDAYEVKIAKRVAELRNIRHRIVELNEQNWYKSRIEAVWWTDGEVNLFHMHGFSALAVNYKYPSCYSLNGYLGDATVGGSYLDKDKSEIFLIQNRGRRFIRQGPRLFNFYHQSRLPFFDYDFLDLAMSLPNELRAKSFIYDKMLLYTFPEYFRKIPSANTRQPISYKYSKLGSLYTKIFNKLKSELGLMRDNSYHDYDHWILSNQTRIMIESLLFEGDVILYEYLDRKEVKDEWEKVKSGYGSTEKMCKYLTIEVYLERLFDIASFNT